MLKIGLFSIGLAAYWPQFPGLRDRLGAYGRFVADNLRALGAEVVDLGMVDDAPKAVLARERFAAEGVDMVVLYVTTYSTSSQVVSAVQGLGKPVLVLNLQPAAALEYEATGTGEWLANCQACCVPEIACAFERCGIPFNSVTGLLGLPERTSGALADERTADHPAARRAWDEVAQWIAAARAARSLRTSRLGFLGHTYPGMLDLYSDLTGVTGAFGCHVEVLEMEDLASHVDAACSEDVAAVRGRTAEVFEFAEPNPNDPISLPPDPEALERAYVVGAGLARLAQTRDLQGLAYYHRGSDLSADMILGLSLLTAKGVPCSGEGDLKNLVAMRLMDSLGAGGSFTELYAMDFESDLILMGHDGPFHLGIAGERPVLRGLALFHGKSGAGVSVEATVRVGPVTVLGVTQNREGRFRLLFSEGHCVPGPKLRIGNTNSRLRFSERPDGPFDVARWTDAWCAQAPTHHVALGVGHVGRTLERVGRILDLETVRVSG